MADPVELLLERIHSLTDELRVVEARLSRLEDRRGEDYGARPGAPVGTAPGDGAAPAVASATPPVVSTLVGRTLVVLGGAYLVRAITDAGLVSAWAGVLVGLAYAGWWIGQAHRRTRAGDGMGATFHLVTSGLIAFPLLWEATVRLGILPTRAADLLLVGFLVAGVIVGDRARLGVAGTLLTLLALATGVALLGAMHDLLGTLCALLAIAAAVEASPRAHEWEERRWAPALVLDAVTLLTVMLVSRSTGLPEHYVAVTTGTAVLVVLALPALYLASLGVRTLLWGHPVLPFEGMQAGVALLVGLGGAFHVVAAHGGSPTALQASLLGVGALCYAAAFAFAERRVGHERNFYFYGTAALALTLAGTATMLTGTPRLLACCVFAAVAALLARRFDRTTLRFHASIFLLAAAATAGLGRGTLSVLLGAMPVASPGAMPAVLVAPVSLVLYAVVTGGHGPAGRAWWERLPHLLVALVALVATVGALTAWLVAALHAQPFVAVDAGMAATVGTVVVASAAVAIAWIGVGWSLPELGWLTYPILVLGALKLAAVDGVQGRPATLFPSLVAYGVALSVAPRLLLRNGRATAEGEEPARATAGGVSDAPTAAPPPA